MMDELHAKHRKEHRELQSRITQKKKNATKKTRKGVNDECETLERQLHERQQAELEAFTPRLLSEQLGTLAIDDDQDGEPTSVQQPSTIETESESISALVDNNEVENHNTPNMSKKPNRQKARLARRAAEQEAQAVAAAEEAASLPDMRARELNSMKTQMDKLGLIETFVRPDGHCLYSACALGIPAAKVKSSGSSTQPYQSIRFVAGNFISEHPDDFAPFLEEPLTNYVDKIKNTAEWGGQLELQAIARAFGVNIKVLQADGRIEEIQHDTSSGKVDNTIWLAYYRHSFGLGEHYNALKKTENPPV